LLYRHAHPSLARNARRRGFFFNYIIMPTHTSPPLPRLKHETEGVFFLLYRHAHSHTSPPLPRSKREMEGFFSFAISSCPPPHISDMITTPPSLEMRDGGVFFFHCIPPPHTPSPSPPLLETRDGGGFLLYFIFIFYFTMTTPPSFEIQDEGA
jgi:hypothetical protein